MKVTLSLELLKSISCLLLIKVHTSLDFPWLSQKLDAARNGASHHWHHIIMNPGNTDILNQETETSGNVYDSEVNPKEGKTSMLVISLCPLFLVIIHSLCHLLDFGILDSRDIALWQVWAAGQKAQGLCPSLYLRTTQRWHALHHMGTWPFHWIHLPGTPGYPSEKRKGAPQIKKQNFLPSARLMTVFLLFWVGRKVLSLTVLLTMN